LRLRRWRDRRNGRRKNRNEAKQGRVDPCAGSAIAISFTSREDTMLKKHIAACLLTTVLAVPASAQSSMLPSSDRPAATGSGSTTSGSSAMQPSTGPAASTPPAAAGSGTTAAGSPSGSDAAVSGGARPSSTAIPAPPGSTSPTAAGPSGMATGPSSGSAMPADFVTQPQQGQWLASRLIGTRVVSANNETIGDVNDVLLDRTGTAQALVIGVGGFLGIGEKDVAVPFRAVEFSAARDARTTGSTTPGGAPDSTGSAAGGAGSTSAAGATAGSGGAPDRIVLPMTRSDLQAAPAFQRARTASSAGAPGGSGTAPPANPGGTPAPAGSTAPRQ